MNTLKNIAIGFAVILSIAAIVIVSGGGESQFGGTTLGYFDAAEGFKVSGTSVVDSSRNVSGGTGTFSSTLTITGETNLDSMIQGGNSTNMTATSTAQTITASQFCDTSLLRWDTSGANSTATVPTAATLIADCVPTIGDTKTLLFENYGGEHATFLAPNASTTLLEPSGGDVIIEDTEWALITIMTQTADTVAIIVSSIQNAD